MGDVVNGPWGEESVRSPGRATRTRRTKQESSLVYQFKISLMEIEPKIWRRGWVSKRITLGRFHQIIQTMMGWNDSHMHQFQINDHSFSDPNYNLVLLGTDELGNEHSVSLESIVEHESDQIIYDYDFGNAWRHQIEVEDMLEPEPGRSSPYCLEGERACPPEDCGGPAAYREFLEALRKIKADNNIEFAQKVGQLHDPNSFSTKEVNQTLRNLRKSG